MWEHVTDADGNEPDGYRVLFASAKRPFHQAKVVRDYLPYSTEVPTTEGGSVLRRGLLNAGMAGVSGWTEDTGYGAQLLDCGASVRQ